MTVHKSRAPSDVHALGVSHFYADSANSVLLVSSSGFVKRDRHLQDMTFQSSVNVNLYFTLSPTADALNPTASVQAGVLWQGPVALAANTLTVPGKTFTALKAVFSAPGEMHIAVP